MLGRPGTSPTPSSSIDFSPGAARVPRGRSRRWWRGMGRWFSMFAPISCAMPHDAQDAFQAAFLVLASRARSIRRREAVGGWLLGVARRVALRSRTDLARRRAYEGRAAEMKADLKRDRAESWQELHEEIGRLPERFREPVVLCYLEGLSTDAAAVRLGCPEGTVLSRLSRARERLQGRLTRAAWPPRRASSSPGPRPRQSRRDC